MAGVLASLNVRIGAEISAFQKGIRDVNSQVRKLTRELDDIGRGLTRSFTVPIGLAAGASIKMAGDFEKSMNRVRALTGSTGEEFEMLRGVAKKLGAETQFSATQAAEGLSFLAMAGFNATQAAEALPGVLDLAAAGAVDLGQAADIASNIMSGFALEIKDLSRLNDVLAKTFTSTNTNLQQLGEAFQYVGPVAASAGLSIEETAAAIGILGNAGIQGSAAGTALRGMISRLLSPTGEAARTLQRLGINAVDASGKLRSMTSIVSQLEKAGATTADMLTIFGDRAGPGMAALVSQGADAIQQLTDKNLNSLGTAAEIAQIQMEGFAGQMEELRSAAEGLAISIGEAGLLTKVTKLAKGITNLVQRLNETSPQVLNMATNIGLVVAAIGPALLGISSMIKAVGTLTKAITLLNTATLGFLGTITTIGAIIGPLLLGISNGIKGINKEIKEGAGQLDTLRQYSGPGQGAYNFQIATGKDRSVTREKVAGTAQQLSLLNGQLDILYSESEPPPFVKWMDQATEKAQELENVFPLPPPVGSETKNNTKEYADILQKIADAAILASRQLDLDRLSAINLGDIKTARERIDTKGLKIDDFDGLTASQNALAAIAEKNNLLIGEQIDHWHNYSDAIPSEAIYEAAEALELMANNMSQVAAAGGTFREVAAEIRNSALSIIGSMIRQGVASVVSGTLTKSAFLGPLAVPLGLAAGALAQGAFNSILRSIKIPAFASGGLAFGPTLGLFGEYQNAANNPEVIAPLNKLKELMGSSNITVNVVGRVSGRDIQLATERNNIISSRLKGR